MPGSKMVSGGYCMYGSSSVLVLALDGEANGYTLDPNIGEFLLTHPKVFTKFYIELTIFIDENRKEEDLFNE